MNPLQVIIRQLPLAVYRPFRRGAVAFRRGSLQRKLCVAVLRTASVAYKGHLAAILPEVRPLDAPHLNFSPTDSMVMDAVYWFGVQGYEGRVADVWITLCQRARSVLEVGGNVGLFTVIGGYACNARYTVVEPVPAVARVLRENLRRNGLSQIEVIQGAVIPGKIAMEVQLQIPNEGRGAPVGSHLSDGVEVEVPATADVITVSGHPFRELVSGRDLVKIDAEGIEAMLLDSARDIILTERPTLLIEVLPEATRLGALIAEFAREAGYTIYILPEWGSNTIVTIAADDFTAQLPRRYNSKDIVLSVGPLPV